VNAFTYQNKILCSKNQQTSKSPSQKNHVQKILSPPPKKKFQKIIPNPIKNYNSQEVLSPKKSKKPPPPTEKFKKSGAGY